MKKIALVFSFIFVISLCIFGIYYWHNIPAPKSYPEEIQSKLDYLNKLKSNLDTCQTKQLSQRQQAEKNQNFSSLQSLNYELIACYEKIADEMFERFYPEKKTEMKNSFDTLIQASYQFAGNLYAYNNTCYSSCGEDCQSNCGLIPNALGTQAATNIVRDMLQKILIYTEAGLK